MTRICSCCGKEFILFGDYMYKTKKNGKTNFQCSYTCYRKEGGDSKPYRMSAK